MASTSNAPSTSNVPMETSADDEFVIEEEGGIHVGDIYIPPPPPPACTFDSTGPRLIISAISNDNFKSYVGKHLLGPFTKSFNCIVGPNGSGKSNVIDSVLFVFGYRAQRIRSKKVSTLIHNSEDHRNIESCTVGIHFKKIIDGPDDTYEDVPGSEFVISRTAFKDNSSFYCINKRRCQFKDVSLQLRSQGIDLDHNRFLILQGEVEQIAMMKPKALTEHDAGMLEYLEDIIGSIRFKVPLEKLSLQIDELNEQWAEKVNRVKVVQKEKDDLETIRNEAITYLTEENERMKKKHRLFSFFRHDTKLKEEASMEEKRNADEKMRELETKCKELGKKLKAAEKSMNAMNEEQNKIKKILDENKAKFSECDKEDLRCREEIKFLLSKEKKLQQNLLQEKKQLKELEAKPAENEKLISELKEKRQELERIQKQEEEEVSKVMASLHLETKGLQDEKDDREAELMGLQKSVNETKSQMDLIQSELDIFISTEQKEKARLQEMKKNYDYVKTTLEERMKSVSELEEKIPELVRGYEMGKNELNQIMVNESSASEKLYTKRLKMEEARSSLQASRSQSTVLSSLMKQKACGNIPGIIGRLGDLGAIDEKYDVAISTACGALDNIVTDTIDTAQVCVEYLKRNNVGLATFIALDKMERWIPYMRNRIQTPENVPRLFDLIRVNDESILPAFYFALRDTLVADNLDQATRIAFQGSTRNRVVSLQGHLIEQSGTMSGGGSKVFRGKMGNRIVATEFTPQQIQDMEAEVEAISREAASLRTEKMRLEEHVEVKSTELNKMKHLLEKYKMDVEAMAKQEKSQSVEVKQQEISVKEAAPDQEKVKQLQSQLAVKTKAYEKASSVASKVEVEVQKLHSKIMEMTGSKMKKAQKKLDDINSKIDENDTLTTKAGVAIKTAQRNMKKVSTKITNIEAEIQENTEKMENIAEERKRLDTDAHNYVDVIKKIEAERDEKEQKAAEVIEEHRKLQEESSGLSSLKLDLQHDLERINGHLQDHHNKLGHWNKELKKLALQEVDGQDKEEFPTYTPEELANVNPKDVQYEIALIDEKLNNMQPNMAAIGEYKKKEQQYLERVKELEVVTEERDGKRQLHDNLRKQRLTDFMVGFNIITSKLKETYQMITLGGDAELELVDSTDPFSEGIVFSVRPPKKSWKNISNLSGGEKTLSSLALVFALHYYKPTPFYFMDEIDAALDFKNVSIIANYVKDRTKNAQFIIISLRDNMFELADRLVGIYKTFNCTKSVSIDPKVIEKNFRTAGK